MKGFSGTLGMTFEEFKSVVREAIDKGVITVTDCNGAVELTDFDLKLTYVMSKLGDKYGYPYEFTDAEVIQEMMNEFGVNVFQEMEI